MICTDLSKAVQEYLQGELDAGVYIGAVHESAQVTFPAVLVDVKAEPVQNSELYKATLTISVMSQVDTSTNSEHATLTRAVGAAMTSPTITSSYVQFYGITRLQVDESQADRHWISTLQFIAGVEAI